VKLPNPKEEQKRVDAWNSAHPVGTPVVRYKLINPKREPVTTATRSAAWLMGGHTGVVMVEGIAGGISLDALEIP
jgi:hypothetical protein